ncbi:hypothetical protein PENCOP_c001G05901 [Penicillium coprophilum]|uniref:Uncharacterized protein n=1 Tax=Penicillium coprophilum TaxID=36646 RepID=A0A1V6V9Y9_9EURO|nr:hypothetical protein PENCOP_c001G05901 [Penicillium coprophilum]
METEENKELAAQPLALPIVEGMLNFSGNIERLSVPLPASPVIEPIPTFPEGTKRPSVPPPPASTTIQPILLSQPSRGLLEELSDHSETLDTQLTNVSPRQQSHYPVMKEALKVLIHNTISLVEYGNQVLYRCGYAEALIMSEWVVRDEQLLLASQLLLENNWPRLLFHEKDWNGCPRAPEYWEAQYLMHDLDGQGWMRVHLIPLSLVGFTLEDTVELPIGHNSRVRIEKDLMGFISAYILKDGPADTTTWTHLNNLESDEDYQKRIEEGIQFMKTWDWGNIEERHLAIAERAVQDCRYIDTLTDVHDGSRMF